MTLLKFAVILVLSLSFELSAFAADKKVVKSTAAVVTQGEVSLSSTTGKVRLSTGPLTADEIIDRLEQSDAKLKSLHCTYQQAMKIPGYGIDQQGDGELWFEKERKLRIEQKSPKKQIVVSDGTLLWIYVPETKQVIQQNWSAFEKNQMVSRGLTQFGSYDKLREKYSVSAATAAAGYVVTLKPKDIKDIPFVLELTVGEPDFIPTRTHMTLNEMEVTTTLNGVEVNPALEHKVFEFEAPAGATLMKTGP